MDGEGVSVGGEGVATIASERSTAARCSGQRPLAKKSPRCEDRDM